MSTDLSSFTASLHTHEIHYVRAGDGPVLVLLHGLLGSGQQWAELVQLLARDYTVIAPDLLGHGKSAKPVGDYSLGGHAARLRDLLDAIGIERITLVGHSLGGGVALQFAYLFPGRCERLVLVDSGGLGREVSALLRAPTLPGAELVMPLVGSWVHGLGPALSSGLSLLGLRAGSDIVEAWRGFVSLGDVKTRLAFLATIRTVVSPAGQSVSALDRLHLLGHIPTLIVWGERDPLIPVQHAYAAHKALPTSRLEVFEGAGHFPHLADPQRFAKALRDFVRATRAAVATPASSGPGDA